MNQSSLKTALPILNQEEQEDPDMTAGTLSPAAVSEYKSEAKMDIQNWQGRASLVA